MFEIASHTATAPSALQLALSVGRGGAAIAAASVANSKFGDSNNILGVNLTAEGRSVLCMATAMSLHYLGYSLARPVTVALFTSASTGYKGFTAAFPFAMALVSPLSLFILSWYGRVLENHGPGEALLRSTLACALTVLLSAFGIELSNRNGFQVGQIPLVKLITGPLFVFRESYVQLLTSQYWSFMASTLTPNQSAKWFGPIAGLTSISSALAGFLVTSIVNRVGLSGALAGTGIMLLLSTFAASAAYRIAKVNGFEPQDYKRIAKKKGSSDLHKSGMYQKAKKLFARVPVLGALFVEILASQGLATVLNVCFVARLGSAIEEDSERAGFVGLFYSVINLCTMVLQFGILPPLMNFIEPKALWRVVPLLSFMSTGFQALQVDPSLYVVSASLMVMKVSEYSARRMLDEMIFVPLDFDARFVGKEVIGVFGYRFGKSLMSLGLSGLTSIFGNFRVEQLSLLSNVVSVWWLASAWRLSNLVPTRAEAEAAHKKDKRTRKGKR